MAKPDSRRVYPVVITPPAEDGFYLAYVPDIDRMTQGETFAEALDMAEDLISIHAISQQDLGNDIPEPSKTEPPHESSEVVTWIKVDFDAYRRSIDTKPVHRGVIIPAYMADRARRMGLNLSEVLQEALKERIGTL
ncbi:MAG: type II toxin-antitoxin system HicB family antitoxin [Clostridiales bacterium]|nr:type II toxin-antitoxin system HicB family antitoxin [Clostridiales bacterium]